MQIAFDLGISEGTVKLHRGSMMRKMRTTSLGRLFQTWQLLPAAVREGGSPPALMRPARLPSLKLWGSASL